MRNKIIIVLAIIFISIILLFFKNYFNGNSQKITSHDIKKDNIKEYFKDDGSKLILKLKNDKTKNIYYRRGEKDGHSETDIYIPSFLGYLQDLGFYIISVNYYESTEVYLINDVTGEEAAQIHDYPKFSSDKNYIIYAQSSDSSENFSGIEIFEIKPHQVKSVYKKEFIGNDFNSWINNQSFWFKSELTGKNIIVKRKESDWIVTEKNN